MYTTIFFDDERVIDGHDISAYNLLTSASKYNIKEIYTYEEKEWDVYCECDSVALKYKR